MKQEDKDLLLKDLCSRLPYGVKCKYYDCCEGDYDEGTICGFERKEYIQIDGVCIHVEEVKPYLFSLSSMTEKQYDQLYIDSRVKEDSIDILDALANDMDAIEWLLKNHFDINGLIEKGLAIDCTNLNIY